MGPPLALALTLALGTLVATPAVHGETPAKVIRIGLLSAGSSTVEPDPSVEVFRDGLRELGYVEGETLTIESRRAEGRAERLPVLATELVRLQVDVIVALGSPALQAARQATGTIPIVAIIDSDPAGAGVLAGLARKGGNVTGVTLQATALTVSLLERLKEALPRLSRVAVLQPGFPSPLAIEAREAQLAARGLRVALKFVGVRSPNDLEAAFSEMAQERVGGVIVRAHPAFVAERSRILELAAAQGLPAIYELRMFVDAGGLMSYGPSVSDLFRRAAGYTDRILRGTRPGDLPVEPSARYELVINLATAKTLGLTIPLPLLLRADRLIE
ncbi:MAG: ABC transporter substrate-binding protein [Candidatus Rokuibacteriota bacterium]